MHAFYPFPFDIVLFYGHLLSILCTYHVPPVILPNHAS